MRSNIPAARSGTANDTHSDSDRYAFTEYPRHQLSHIAAWAGAGPDSGLGYSRIRTIGLG